MQNMVLQNQDIKIDHASTKSVLVELFGLTAQGQPFEVIDKVREDINYQAFATLPENLKAMFKTSADTYGDADFIVFKDERHSFKGLYQQASEFAYALVEQYQISAGDRVTISMRNYPEWIVAFMAITSIGAIAVPLNAWWTQDEFAQVIGHCDATLAIVDDKRYDLLSSCLAEHNTPVIIARPSLAQRTSLKANVESFEELIAKYKGQVMPEVAVGSDAIATIFYTSGSTGSPKGAVSSHESILTAINTWVMLGASASAANSKQNIQPSVNAPVALMTVPLFHVTGCHTLFLLSMIIGRKTIMMTYWEPEEALRLIEKEKITYFNGVPTMSMELMNHPNKSQYDLSSLNDICAGGAARPPEHVRKIYDSFKSGNPSCGYGLTETNALGAVNGAVDYVQKPNSAGLPTPPIVEVKILDEAGNSLAVGEQGEIVIKTMANILGYWRNPEATEAAFTDGYFRTGDLGFLDEDGFIYIVDRAKDIIIRGGENIACLEVEACLYKHALVGEVSVFALPDERLGEVVGAVVYVGNTSAEISETILQAFVAEHLAKFKVPSKVWIINENLPRLGSGKIDKRTLKETYITNL
ncbi:class I adenylate-forming enzyme family protein [Colwellia piezophila]|uniref:class I adenylate-forming enzyme family protein n=1 Tax=Colwellia piezophila TaxID=211668 RepID=UPI000381F30F|nr:class I adenylate-forming enzyme family protein [Colwellia piezophila]